MNTIRQILVLLIFVIYIYPINFKFYNTIGMYLIYDMIPIFTLLWNYRLILSWCKNKQILFLKFFAIYFFMMLWGLISVVVNDGDFTYFDPLLRILQIIIIYIFLAVIQCRILKEVNIDIFLKYYVCSSVVYVGSTIVFLLNQELRDLWTQLLVQNERQLEIGELISQQTRYGLKGFSNFLETAICSLSAGVSLYFMHRSKAVVNVWIGTFLICLLGCFFYGRVGVITTVFFLIYYEIADMSSVNFKRIITILLFFIACVGIAFYLAEYDARLELWLEWISKPVEYFFEGIKYGQISFGPSTDKLTNEMYFMPEDWTFIFGDGFYTNNDGSYYMHTDAGVLRHILFYGILGELLGYALLVLPVIWISKLLKKNKDKLGIILMRSFIIFVIFFEIKGVVYFNFIGWIIVIMMLVECENGRTWSGGKLSI